MRDCYLLPLIKVSARLVFGLFFLLGPLTTPSNGAVFQSLVVDPDLAGDCKAVGDIDGDGYPDLVVGGMPNEKLNWYRYPNWVKTIIATPAMEFTTDCSMGDVDGDGDLDIIVPDGNLPDNLLWFENPRPGGDPSNGANWIRRIIGSVGDYGKDVKPADFDQDGRLDVATRGHQAAMIFFQTAPNVWSKVLLNVSNLGSEGLGLGDINKDGHMDLVVKGAWLRNPGGLNARSAGNWTEYPVGQTDASFKALVADLNGDTQPDIVFSSSENTADLAWWRYGPGGPTGSWTRQTIVQDLEKAHTLQAADMDNDGDLDIITAQMHTSQNKEVMVWYNLNGQGTAWQKQVLGTGGLHNGQVADIGNDGRMDIFGANWTGYPPVRLWRNLPPASRPVSLPFLLLLMPD
jgi:hypothetical protein